MTDRRSRDGEYVATEEELLILDGLNGRPHPPGGHNRSACLWLSSAPPGKADTWGVETDVSLDQMLAAKLGKGARQKSLEMSCTTVGPAKTMNVAGKMNSSVGNKILTAAC